MSADGLLPEDDELLAAELAFGLLDDDDRLAAERRAQTDNSFASAYRRWQDHAAGLVEGNEKAPPESVWLALQRGLPANDTAQESNTLRWWQAGTGLATACALVFGIMWFEKPVLPPSLRVAAQPAPPLVAILRGKKDAVVAIVFDRTTGRLTATPSSLNVLSHAAELWVIPADGRPRSLGLIASAGPTSHVAASTLVNLLRPGAALAVSLEPIGGSPTGKPTGEVILSGKIEKS